MKGDRILKVIAAKLHPYIIHISGINDLFIRMLLIKLPTDMRQHLMLYFL